MLEEIVPIILEVLTTTKKAVKIEEILEISSCERLDVLKGLNLLQELGLVVKETKTNINVYSLVKELKAINLAKSAQLGIDLSPFESYFKIDKKEKQLALELATHSEKIKNLELNKRKPLLQKRNYLISSKPDDTYENLSILLEATNGMLYEYLEKLAEKDPSLKLLMNTHEQAESSLRDYIGHLK